MEQEVTLTEMLEAREARVRAQDSLRERYGVPVISFTLNIAGPVKDSPLIRRAFRTGQEELRTGLRAAKLEALWQGENLAPTGCEGLYAVKGTAKEVKALCVSIEDGSPLGRLFDMDVLDRDGRKLDREEVGGGPRNCIVCGAPGKGCASRRVHTVEQLQKATRRILEDHFAAAGREKVSALVTQALLDEVCTTPSPAWWTGPTTAVTGTWTSSRLPPAPPPWPPTGGSAFRLAGRQQGAPPPRPSGP